MKNKKRFIVFAFISLPLLLILASNYSIEKYASGRTYSESSEIENNKVGLVLGTSKMLKNGKVNLYFTYRIQATVELYEKGRINFILVSGDNGKKNYDEPSDFKNELIKNGIPESKIFLDYAGFRTLDSVVRSKEIFGQESITIISQQFHNERAIYIAKNNGIKAIGFNARDVSGRYGLKVKIREYLARAKVFVDILFGVKPKFLGDKIDIN